MMYIDATMSRPPILLDPEYVVHVAAMRRVADAHVVEFGVVVEQISKSMTEGTIKTCPPLSDDGCQFNNRQIAANVRKI